MKSAKKPTRKSPANNAVSGITSQRLDTWLWASRFFKTRKLAAEAVSAGHIDVNGSKAKPGKAVKIDDLLEITRHHEHYSITITALSTRRLSATMAVQLFVEPKWSEKQRHEQTEMRKQNQAGVRYDFRKPHRRERKQMLKIKNQRPDSN
jgi:ribosome-associated heat shock protein Hsp15